MKKIVVLICGLLASCCGIHSEVEYKYGNTVIKRIDECGKTTFFYGNSDGKIWAEYSGINDGFSGYLKFNSDGSVILLSGDGYFRSEGVDTTQFSFKRVSYDAPEIGGPVCAISLSTKHEIEENQNAKSAVEVKYNIDKNEWW